MTEQVSVLDGIDRAVLRELQEDGRISFRDLGKKVGLSANAAAERVRRLRADGIIQCIGATLNPRALGFGFFAYVDIKTGGATGPEELKKVLATIPEVRRAVWTTGNYDFTLEVAFRDQDDLVRVIELLRKKCGIQESYTRLICRELFATPRGWADM